MQLAADFFIMLPYDQDMEKLSINSFCIESGQQRISKRIKSVYSVSFSICIYVF